MQLHTGARGVDPRFAARSFAVMYTAALLGADGKMCSGRPRATTEERRGGSKHTSAVAVLQL
jgi:hypothetical protein